MRLFGLIGFPLGHSFSGKYFSEKFHREGISDARYNLFPISEITAFPQLWKEHPDLLGLNVTIPYKETVIPYLDEQTEMVSAIGACNCIKKEKGRLVGHNTDVTGFEKTLRPLLGPVHRKALILGTGGASKAVAYVLSGMGIAYQYVSRNPGSGDLNYEGLSAEVMRDHKLIINTTPLGMHPDLHALPSIPYQALGENHLLYDLIYNPAETAFLRLGREMGAKTCNGKEMLVVQAEESWRIWNS